jgi:hypothetical protein
MTINNHITKRIVEHVIKSEDYRIEIVNLINGEFLQFAIDFFKNVAIAKLDSQDITIEWYKKTFLNTNLSKEDFAVNSGLNMKTISNMYGTSKREIVLDASEEHFGALCDTIQSLVTEEGEIDLTLTIRFNNVAVDLNVNESLIVINVLAVKRASLRGGLWSTAGKKSEKVLMLALCKLYGVSEANYNSEHFVRNRKLDFDREIDFYLRSNDRIYKCEVKLMGKGNPESADAIIARDTDVFVADTLSQQNKNQCDALGVKWIACRDTEGYKKFGEILIELNIPHRTYDGNICEDLPRILDEML